MTLQHSLLESPCFQVGDAEGVPRVLTLPETLAQLSQGHDLRFLSLRPHQHAPWHAFLVQLAFLALEENAKQAVLLANAEEWAVRLRRLTPSEHDDGAWSLLNTDWQRPAFLQVPCLQGQPTDYKRSADTAQDIDVLVTAKHHDEKADKLPLRDDGLDALVYALVTLQGWSSFLGAGNYGSMRMNGGFGSRSQFRLAFRRGTGAEFCRDVIALLESREALHAARTAAGIGIEADCQKLLWLTPWTAEPLSLSRVHPLCLEVCRRVRLERGEQGLRLLRAGSSAMRVAAKDARGVVLDPWIPVIKDGDGVKALTAQTQSLHYRRLQELVFDRQKTELPLLARPTPRERRDAAGGDATFVARVLVSGDGGTDGLLVRELTLPPTTRRRYEQDTPEIGTRSRHFVDLAARATGKVLRPALLQFMDGTDDVQWKNPDFARAVDTWVDRYDARIDEAFFVQLFDTFERTLDDIGAQREWARWLAVSAREQLLEATKSLATRDDSRWFAQVRAERFLNGALRKQFVTLLDPTPEMPIAGEAHHVH